jgi:hypothetical protein
MQNSQLPEVMVAIATLVPKQMTLKELAVKLDCTVDRLNAIKLGANLTAEEAVAFANECGGVPLDYRSFVLQDNAWWQCQSADLQAKVQQIVEQANYSFKKRLGNVSIYNKQLAIFAVVAFVIIIMAVGHGTWIRYKYQKLRPEANRYIARLYTHRQIAWAQAGIEVANLEIIKMKYYANLINESKLSPANRAAVQRVLLDLVRYYRAVAINYQQIQKQTELTLNNPKCWNDDNILLDPFTYQPIDVEDVDGGQLDQEKIKELIRLQLNIVAIKDTINDLIDGKTKADSIPKIEDWGKISVNGD